MTQQRRANVMQIPKAASKDLAAARAKKPPVMLKVHILFYVCMCYVCIQRAYLASSSHMHCQPLSPVPLEIYLIDLYAALLTS
jgi:hypothetical protein